MNLLEHISQFTRVLALAAAFLATGCADDAVNISDYQPQDPTCQTSSQCVGEQVCQLGRCVYGEPGKSLLLDLYVRPLNENEAEWTAAPFQALSVVTGESELELTVPPPATINGRVRFANEGEDDIEPVQATVFIRAKQGIPSSLFQTSIGTEADGSFSVQVPPGNYEVTVIPSQRPDIPERLFNVDELVGSRNIDFVIARPDNFLRWQGRIVQQTEERVLKPIPSATVYAISEDNGTLSTKGVTDEDGVFTLFVDPDEGPFRFQVRPQRTDSGEDNQFAIPNASFSPVDPIITSDDPLTGELPGSGDLIAGSWSIADEVIGTVVDANGVPVSGARIVATTDGTEEGVANPSIPLESSVHTYRTSSDEDGVFSLQLIQGVEYTLRAAATGERRLLSAVSTIDTDLDLEELRVALSQPSRRTIDIDFPDSETPAEGVTVRATPLTFRNSEIAEYGVSPDSLRAEAVTDLEGRAELEIFSGQHRFDLIPEDASGLPNTTRQIFVPSRETQVDLDLSSGGIIRGELSSSTGSPVTGATVEAFINGSSRVVSTTTSTAEGQFSLILPTE
jgi:hypothetical protein